MTLAEGVLSLGRRDRECTGQRGHQQLWLRGLPQSVGTGERSGSTGYMGERYYAATLLGVVSSDFSFSGLFSVMAGERCGQLPHRPCRRDHLSA